MPSFLSIYKTLLYKVMNMAGVQPQAVEIEPGTVINMWAPKNPGNKPPVVFLHGFATDGIFTWQFQVLALAKNYAVYVPDFLFFGGSITDKADRTVEFQAECMEKALRRLGVRRCTVVGLSYGGIVGFEMAEKYPDFVESMVVTNSVMALTESVSTASLERIGFPSWVDYLLPNTPSGVRVLFRVGCYKFPWLPNFLLEDFLETFNNNWKEKAELLQALVISDKEFSAPNFQQRIHLLFGKNDKIFDVDTACNQKELIREKATLHFIDKSGHLPQLEKPFIYNNRLKKILISLTKEN